jgi:hypothetical protein
MMKNEYTHDSIVQLNIQIKDCLPNDVLEVINEKLIINNVIGSERGSLDIASLNNNLKLLKLYHRYNLPHTHLTFDYACMNGNYEMILYLHNNGFKGSSLAMDLAAKKGHLHIVKWLCNNNYSCSTDALFCANINNHISIINYICKHINNISCTRADLNIAMNSGNFQIIQYVFNKVFNDNKNFIKYSLQYGFIITIRMIQNLINNNNIN